MHLAADLDQSSNCGCKVIVINLRIRIFIQEIYVMQVILLWKESKNLGSRHFLEQPLWIQNSVKLKYFMTILKTSWSSAAVGELFL